jgi:OOP family OmpA-OmpF porin
VHKPSLFLGLAASLWLAAAAPAHADCRVLDTDVKAALGQAAVARFDALYAQVQADTSCDAVYRSTVGRLMARIVLSTLPTDADAARIEVATKYGRPWQVLVAIGDAYYAKSQWPQAQAAYEEALDDMRDVAANPAAPPADIEQRTYKRAVQARALAPTYLATRQVRGEKTGLANPNFRNFTAVSVPVPVQFDVDQDVLTPQGQAAVKDIYAYLSQQQGLGVVRIIGHTDPRGSDAYNYDLSQRRAASVAAFLQYLGYHGRLEVQGKGKTEPFQPDDASKYSPEQIWAFDRRVEYQVLH